ncbi:hypothetical protein ACFWF3_12265 [Nocardia sp. NPDC060220]|uniref:hypothetical protein n=1 Tax=Nocardia sp. NPDC060220 TaxID=3347076 RepID=UPI003655F246
MPFSQYKKVGSDCWIAGEDVGGAGEACGVNSAEVAGVVVSGRRVDDVDAAGPSDKGADAVVGDTDPVGVVVGGLPSHPANANVAAAISPTANRPAVTVISTPF